MRALLLAIVPVVFFAAAPACSFTIDTTDLAGGTPRDAGGDANDAAPCDPTRCFPQAQVVPISSIAPCSKDGTTDKMGCRKLVHDTCVALDSCCFVGGVGPVDFPNAEQATIVCSVGTPYVAPLTEFTKTGTGCAGPPDLGSRACDQAIHVSAAKRGLTSAYLQTVDGNNATIIGYNAMHAFITIDALWSDLTAQEPGCTGPDVVESQACTTAVHRFCATDGTDVSGYGPVLWNKDNVTFVCLY